MTTAPPDASAIRLDGLKSESHRHTLSNGLRVVLQPDDSLPLVAVNLWYHVGSKNEQPGRTGLAHLFEHMLFQGSQHVGTNDHFAYVQQVGGVANGSTWFDRTNYYETLPSSHLELGLWLESDRMGYLLPALTQEKLDNQRDVVINERRQRVDNQPYGRAFERLHELLYGQGHPYSWPVIGYIPDLEATSLDDVSSFFRRFYAPSNAVLTLVGDIQPERELSRIERFFGEIPRGPEIEPVTAPPSTSHSAREVLEDDVELRRLYIGFRTPGCHDPSWRAGELLSTVLADGKPSRLYRELVYERQLAQDVSAFSFPTELEATFVIVSTARPGVDPAELESTLFSILEDELEHGIDPASLERARLKTLTGLFESIQSFDQRADMLSRYTTLFDDPDSLHRVASEYVELTRSDLQAFGQTHLRRDRSTIIEVAPRTERPS